MRQVKCSVCGRGMIGGASGVMLQSAKWPTVFIHGGPCRNEVFRVLFEREGFPSNKLTEDLTLDEATMALLRQNMTRTDKDIR